MLLLLIQLVSTLSFDHPVFYLQQYLELSVEFSSPTYASSETGILRVGLVLNGGTSESRIQVVVTPSQQLPPSATGKTSGGFLGHMMNYPTVS